MILISIIERVNFFINCFFIQKMSHSQKISQPHSIYWNLFKSGGREMPSINWWFFSVCNFKLSTGLSSFCWATWKMNLPLKKSSIEIQLYFTKICFENYVRADERSNYRFRTLAVIYLIIVGQLNRFVK